MPNLASTLKSKRNKFGAKGFRGADGEWWASKWEYDRYQELKTLEKAGLIRNLQRQTKWPLVVEGVMIGNYISDADYYENLGPKADKRVVEDAKCAATITATYRLKKKLFKALYGIEIKEAFRKK